MTVPSNLLDIRNKVRRITGRPSTTQISDAQIDNYINTFYIYDFPEHLQLISNRVNFQFVTTANTQIYDLPDDIYLTGMPPVYIGGYQSYMTQSRENFYRINPALNYLQQSVATGNGSGVGYSFTLINTPITGGWKPNPPGAYSLSSTPGNDIPANLLNWMVLISSTTADGNSVCLVDDGQGNLFNPGNTAANLNDPPDASTDPALARGSIDYATGLVQIPASGLALGFSKSIPIGTAINAQYVPYVASRPQSCVFFQQQFNLYPIPDQAYTVSFEAYRLPTALIDNPANEPSPQMTQWWQALAIGAALKIFEDNGDMENWQKYYPLLEHQLKLVQRRTIVQQTSERAPTIYTEQTAIGQYPFGNIFSGF